MSDFKYCEHCTHYSRPQGSPQGYKEYRMFVYPPGKKIPNKKWDTYDINTLGCDNYTLSHYQTSNIGIKTYKCLGHPAILPEVCIKKTNNQFM